MRFENECGRIKIYFLICILLATLMVIFIAVEFNDFSIRSILFLAFYFIVDLYCIWVYIGKLGYCVIDENGIYRKTLFFEKHYKWSEILFISRAEFLRSDNYILFSVNTPREKLRKKPMFFGNSKKYFMLPYSEKLESYVIINSPEGCYTYDYIFKRDF